MASLFIQVTKHPKRCPCGKNGSYSFGHYQRSNWRRLDADDYCVSCALNRAIAIRKLWPAFENVRERRGSAIPEWMLWPESCRIRTGKGSQTVAVYMSRDGLAITHQPVPVYADRPYVLTHTRSGMAIACFASLTYAVKAMHIAAEAFDWTMRARFLVKSSRCRTFVQNEIFPMRDRKEEISVVAT